MRDAFSVAIEFTLKHEGGWSKDPADPGGETYHGISRRAHPTWEGWQRVDELADKSAFSLALDLAVRAFYRRHYWDPIYGDQLPPRLALVIFDWAVHGGVDRAIRSLQKLVGSPPDGVFGPETLASVTKYMDRSIARSMVERRRASNGSLIESNPKLERFRNGWANRLRDLGDQIA
jgi:lysozyme family protein